MPFQVYLVVLVTSPVLKLRTAKKFKLKDEVYELFAEIEVSGEDDIIYKSNELNKVIMEKMKPILSINKRNSEATRTKVEQSPDKNSKSEKNSLDVLICPECDQEMRKQPGKDYYLDDMHYGYPDQIVRGEVKKRKYKKKR